MTTDKYKTYFSENSKCSNKKSCDNQKNIFLSSGSASVNVDPDVITKAMDKGFTTELAFLILLKGVYKNSRIYNVRKPKERIAQLTGLSVPTVNRYFNKLGFYGLITPQPFGWQLATIKPNRRNRHKRNNYSIDIDFGANVSKIKRLLFAKVLENKAKSQALIESLYQFHRKGIDARQRNEGLNTSEPLRGTMSTRYIAKLLNISVTTAMKLVEMLNSDGVLRTLKPQPEYMFTGCGPEVLAHLMDSYGYKYVRNKSLYKIDPAVHYFPESDYKARPIDYKRHKRLMKNPGMQKINYRIYQLVVNQHTQSKVEQIRLNTLSN